LEENLLCVRYLATAAEPVEALGENTQPNGQQWMVERRDYWSPDQVRRDRPLLSRPSSEHGDSSGLTVEWDRRAY
jgi:hypothetical protein